MAPERVRAVLLDGGSLSGKQEIYCWNHEDDSRMWVASTVMQFFEQWMTGGLRV